MHNLEQLTTEELEIELAEATVDLHICEVLLSLGVHEYGDRVLAGTSAGNFTAPAITSSDLRVTNNDNYSLNGWMDELAIFSRALTADEVRAIYESDAPLSANTSSVWELEE